MSENQEKSEQTTQGESKSGGMTFLLIAAVLALLIIGVIGAFIIKKKISEKNELDSQRELIKVNWQSK
jgi:flagellar basal body-associated protein FliL